MMMMMMINDSRQKHPASHTFVPRSAIFSQGQSRKSNQTNSNKRQHGCNNRQSTCQFTWSISYSYTCYQVELQFCTFVCCPVECDACENKSHSSRENDPDKNASGRRLLNRRARCPIVSNSVMTGWQQNRWLAAATDQETVSGRWHHHHCPPPPANVNKGNHSQPTKWQKSQFFITVDNCFAKRCFPGGWFDDGRCPHLSDKSPFPARKIFLSPPSQLFFWICQHRDTTY